MSVLVRSATYGNVVGAKVEAKKEELNFALPDLPILVLVLVALFSALSFVYVKDLNRRLFVSSTKLTQSYAQLQVQREQLLLERSMWSAQSRIQQVADQLEMRLPSAKEIVMIKI